MQTAQCRDNLNLLQAIIVAVLSGVAVLVVMVVAQWRFDLPTPTAVAAAHASADSSESRQLHNQQTDVIKSCRWIDKSKGVVSVPIERAMELTVREMPSRPLARDAR